jgi:hypothetical protein
VNLKLIKNYLTGRGQKTIANGALSSSLDVLSGVPQGSVIGPILFLIYVNDMVNELIGVTVNQFADDTCVYVSHKDIHVPEKILEKELSKLYTWSKDNKLTLNVSKTKVMKFGTRENLNKINFGDLNIKLGGIRIEQVKSYKYLGIWLDEALTFTTHIHKLISSLNYKLCFVHKKVKGHLIHSFAVVELAIIPYQTRI